MSLGQAALVALIVLFVGVGFYKETRRPRLSGPTSGLGWFAIASGIAMSFVGGAALLSMASVGYQYGVWGFVDPLSVCIGSAIAIGLIPAIRRGSKQTIADACSNSKVPLKQIIATITILVYILMAAAQLAAIRKVLLPVFSSTTAEMLVILVCVSVAAYICRGGLSSVSRTDVVQLLAVVATFVLPAAFGIMFASGPKPSSPIASVRMPLDMVVLFALPLLFVPASQDIFVRAAAAKSSTQAILGIAFGAACYSAILSLVLGIGMYFAAQGISLTDPELIVPTFISSMNPGLAIFPTAALLAATISSLDSFVWNASHSVRQDLLPRQWMKHNLSNILGPYIAVGLAYGITQVAPGVLALVLTSLLLYISTIVPIACARWIGVSDRSISFGAGLFIVAYLVAEAMAVTTPLKPVALPAIHFIIICTVNIVSKIAFHFRRNR